MSWELSNVCGKIENMQGKGIAMRAFKFVIPMMLLVGGVAWVMLNKNFTDVPVMSRFYITLGAMVLSGVISFFLFPKDEGKRR